MITAEFSRGGGMPESAAPGPLDFVFDANAGTGNSWDGEGDASNEVYTESVAPATFVSIAWNSDLASVGSSWCSEAVMRFDTPDVNLPTLYLTVGFGVTNPCTETFAACVNFADAGLPDIVADGTDWTVELFEGFDDVADAIDATHSNLSVLFSTTPCPLPPPKVTINEIRIDQSGDDNDEYFEICGPAGAPLDGLTYLVLGDDSGDGSGDLGKRSGAIEAVVDLAGSVIPASGYFVACESTFSLGPCDLVTSLNFENSDNVTHMVVAGFTGSDGDDLDFDNDCELDLLPWDSISDAVSLVETPNPPASNSDECVYEAFPQVGPDGTFVPGHVYRCVDCIGAWQIGPFAGGDDTPGADNACPTEACKHTVALFDSFGDGWDGASMDVLVEGVLVLDDITVPNPGSEAIFGFIAATGDVITTVYTSGSFESEHSYEIRDVNGIVIGSDGVPYTGSPPGPGITATGNCEPVEFGACCLPDVSCQDVANMAECDAIEGGLFQGVGSTCATVECPLPPPANDDCANAEAVAVPSLTAGTTLGASFDDVGFCGTSNTAPGVWYSVTGTGNTMTATTCENQSSPGSADYDTKISVFCDGCETPTCVGGNDDESGCSFHSTFSWCSEAGVEYLILVHGFSANVGNFMLSVFDDGAECGDPTVPCGGGGLPNDNCSDRVDIFDGLTPFSTIGATTDGPDDAACSGLPAVANDIWFNYDATCTGLLTVDTCEDLGGSADFDTKITIYDGCTVGPGCPSDPQIGCNDDASGLACGTGAGGFHSAVSVDVTQGNCYKIRVGGFSEGEVGSGDLQVSCEPLTDGACCLPDDSCITATAEDCSAQGGKFNGLGTDCASIICFSCPASSCETGMTQSATNADGMNTVACGLAGTGTTENSWTRCYDLNAELGFPSVTLNSLTWGVQQATADGINVNINVYEIPGTCDPVIPFATANLVSTDAVVVNMADVGLDVVTPLNGGAGITVSGSVVVEIFQVDDGTVDPTFSLRPRSNPDGQCDSSYIRTVVSCGPIADWTDLALIGFASAHLYQELDVSCAECGNGVIEGDEECDEGSLLVNAGFEDGLNGWSSFDAIAASSAFAHTGTMSAKIGPTGTFANTLQRFGAVEGQTFSGTTWAYVDSAEAIAAGSIDFAVAKIEFCSNPPEEPCAEPGGLPGSMEVQIANSGTPTDQWIQYTIPDAVVPAGVQSVNFVYVWVPLDNMGGAVYVDDAEFFSGGGCCNEDCTLVGAGTVCSPGSSDCEADAVCDGQTGDCPANQPEPDGTLCRAAAGPCDIAESCDGTSIDCPADAFEPDGTVCSPGDGACVLDSTCDGSSAGCPPNDVIGQCSGLISDSCCPAGCNANQDVDCEPVCGNERTEPGECCDDGNLEPGDGCDEFCQCEAPPVPAVTPWGMAALLVALGAGLLMVFGRRRKLA